MRIDASLLGSPLAAAASLALSVEAAGYDGAFTFDGPHEPFSPLVLAAEHTRLELSTGVAIAFASILFAKATFFSLVLARS